MVKVNNESEKIMTTITAILTCFNRKEKTIKCLKSLCSLNRLIEFSFIVVDDKSEDGTPEELAKLPYNITILHGDGNLFWAGGMRYGIDYYLEKKNKSDYILLINDDVEFFDSSIEKMLSYSVQNNNAIIVGATCNEQGEFTYGALKVIEKRKNDLYKQIMPSDGYVKCDTFNANCVLLKSEIVREVGNFDPLFTHSLADLDYGLMIRKNGYNILSSQEFVGICFTNDQRGTWRDTTLSRKERIKKKESVKGAPLKEWFHFMNKNFGFFIAIRYSVTPYMRILMKK